MCNTIQIHGFPLNISAEDVLKFLEQHAGFQTVLAIEIDQYKDEDPMTHVNVQFKDKKNVETILDFLVTKHLSYNENVLNAILMKHNLLPNPRLFSYSMDGIGIHFGCQISKEKLGVLWEHSNVCVKFGVRLRKMYIFLRYSSKDYKLQINSESISRIEMYHSHCRTKKILLFQLRNAPRIYEEDVSENKYFKEAYNNNWFRGVDFTPSCCIGHSSTLCLELPQCVEIPNFHDHFRNYYEFDNTFVLEKQNGFSSNFNFVPMVIPPEGFNLPFKIRFKINSLVQHGCLPLQAIDTNLFRMVDPKRMKFEYIESALNKLHMMKECCYEPVQWLEEQYKKYSKNSSIPISSTISLDNGLIYVHRVKITPSKIYFCGPEVNLSNRVLRNFPEDTDNFLRVSFVDEDMDKLHSSDLLSRFSCIGADRETKVHQRVLSTLKKGIEIGDKKFEFLAFSSSQLRDNSVWMFASRKGLTTCDIRKWMGDFNEIKSVAKYAARLGQSFSSSRETVNVGRNEIEIIPDIELKRGEIEYCFSDGIGKISYELAKEVAEKCGCKDNIIPSAFQIRYGGYKGVVAIDPNSSTKLSLRKSMCKFNSQNTKLDVLSWSKHKPCFLNRQVIVLLSTLGVKDRVFKKMQRDIVHKLKIASRKPFNALDMMSQGEISNMLREMIICGFDPKNEPFLSMMLRTICASKLQELMLKTRIFVRKGRSLLGCLDETRTLKYGEVFVQISSPRNKGSNSNVVSSRGIGARKGKYIVKGKVVVAKNPCLHPGDVRILRAIDVPSLHHMVDCVVFPQKGRRPHPNECSGSDLDGDIYFVCWDPALIPLHQENPMDHLPSKPINLDHDVTLQDIEEHFTHYIVKDTLGIISNAHTVFADKEPEKAMSHSCIELAKLHSIAVDFAKSGIPAEIPQHLQPKQYPDFMEKQNKPSYQSTNIIGKLYRDAKNVAEQKSHKKKFTRKMAMKLYDHDMKIDGFEKYTKIVCEYKHMYDSKLENLMDYYGVETEGEIISGNILKMSKSFNDRKDKEGINHAIMSLRNETRSWFNDIKSKSNYHCHNDDYDDDDGYAIASAMYHVTYHSSYWGCYNEGINKDHFISFPWCVHDVLVKIKKDKVNSRIHGIKVWTRMKMFFIILMFCILLWIIVHYLSS